MPGYVCEICSKKSLSGNNVSHSHRKTKKMNLPNLQKTKIDLGSGPQAVRICTRCMRSLYKVKK